MASESGNQTPHEFMHDGLGASASQPRRAVDCVRTAHGRLSDSVGRARAALLALRECQARLPGALEERHSRDVGGYDVEVRARMDALRSAYVLLAEYDSSLSARLAQVARRKETCLLASVPSHEQAAAEARVRIAAVLASRRLCRLRDLLDRRTSR